jgi:hypothetical protein
LLDEPRSISIARVVSSLDWLIVAALGVVAAIRAWRWRDQPWGSAWVTPLSLAVAMVGLIVDVLALALLGIAGVVVGFVVDRFYMWRRDSTGYYNARARDRAWRASRLE